jgi:para-nitrobenzyl esterase
MPKCESYFLTFILFFSYDAIANDIDDFVITSSGKVKGYLENNVINYDDIPYAEPPVGDLRWKAPREITNSNIIISKKANNFCIQEPSSMGGAPGDGILTGSEDCLYLDIKLPKKKSRELLPVMFWIHGGGNTSGLKDLYDYSKMASRHDVIVVSINYRL